MARSRQTRAPPPPRPALTAAQIAAAAKEAADDIKTFLEEVCSFKKEGARGDGVPDQADVDKVTWLEAKYYPAKE